MLLTELLWREQGWINPSSFSHRWTKRKWLNLGVSPNKMISSLSHSAVNCLDFDYSDFRYLLSCTADGEISIFDTSIQPHPGADKADIRPMHDEKAWRAKPHMVSISSVNWYPHDNGLFVSGALDGRIKVWDTKALTCAQTFNIKSPVYDLGKVCQKESCLRCHVDGCVCQPCRTVPRKCSSQQPLIYTKSHSIRCFMYTCVTVRLCDIVSGAFSHSLLGHNGPVWSVCWSPSSEYILASGSGDHTLRIWDIRRASPLMVLDHTNLTNPYISPSVSSSEKGKKELIQSHSGGVTHIQYTHDGRCILSSGTDGRLRKWDTQTGKNTLINFRPTKNVSKACRFSVTCDDLYVLYPQGKTVQMHDINSGDVISTLSYHFEDVTCVVSHPFSVEVFSASLDQSICVYEPLPPEHTREDDLHFESHVRVSDSIGLSTQVSSAQSLSRAVSAEPRAGYLAPSLFSTENIFTEMKTERSESKGGGKTEVSRSSSSSTSSQPRSQSVSQSRAVVSPSQSKTEVTRSAASSQVRSQSVSHSRSPSVSQPASQSRSNAESSFQSRSVPTSSSSHSASSLTQPPCHSTSSLAQPKPISSPSHSASSSSLSQSKPPMKTFTPTSDALTIPRSFQSSSSSLVPVQTSHSSLSSSLFPDSIAPSSSLLATTAENDWESSGDEQTVGKSHFRSRKRAREDEKEEEGIPGVGLLSILNAKTYDQLEAERQDDENQATLGQKASSQKKRATSKTKSGEGRKGSSTRKKKESS